MGAHRGQVLHELVNSPAAREGHDIARFNQRRDRAAPKCPTARRRSVPSRPRGLDYHGRWKARSGAQAILEFAAAGS